MTEILVECKADKVLIQSLLNRRSIHAGNKSEVLKQLVKHHSNSVGIIDEDPHSHQPPHLQKFRETENLAKYGIRIFVQEDKNNKVLMICPRLEDWIIEAAHELKVNLEEKYGLPDDADKLHARIGQRLDSFRKLIEDLKTTSDRIRMLEACLQSSIL